MSSPLDKSCFSLTCHESLKVHYDQLARVIDTHRGVPQAGLIKHLNPIIRGWANYYATVVSKVTYSKLDYLMYQKLRAWANRRHPQKTGCLLISQQIFIFIC
ncbi:MAG: group II intron maturase-specific domain-containing protein [Aulosira sp. DedQUE10]|nr:group II intron maturase-specific domain-containing protein [Aulosira sp. DedQUE10]